MHPLAQIALHLLCIAKRVIRAGCGERSELTKIHLHWEGILRAMATLDKNTAVSIGLVIVVCALVWSVASTHTKSQVEEEQTKLILEKLESISTQQAQLITQNSQQITNLQRQFDESQAAGPRWSAAMEVLQYQLEKDRGAPVHPEEVLKYFSKP